MKEERKYFKVGNTQRKKQDSHDHYKKKRNRAHRNVESKGRESRKRMILSVSLSKPFPPLLILIFLSVFEVDFVSFSPFTAFSSCVYSTYCCCFLFPHGFLYSLCVFLFSCFTSFRLSLFPLFAPDRNGIFARLLPLLFPVDRPLTEHWENAVIYPVHYSILGENIRPSSPPQCNSQMK